MTSNDCLSRKSVWDHCASHQCSWISGCGFLSRQRRVTQALGHEENALHLDTPSPVEVDSSPAASLEEDEPQCEAQASSMVAGSWDGVEAMDEPLSPLSKDLLRGQRERYVELYEDPARSMHALLCCVNGTNKESIESQVSMSLCQQD